MSWAHVIIEQYVTIINQKNCIDFTKIGQRIQFSFSIALFTKSNWITFCILGCISKFSPAILIVSVYIHDYVYFLTFLSFNILSPWNIFWKIVHWIRPLLKHKLLSTLHCDWLIEVYITKNWPQNKLKCG